MPSLLSRYSSRPSNHFLSSNVDPQKKRAVALSISWQVVIGNRKQFIEYVGIACMIDLISTSFPACESVFSFQSFIFWMTLSTIPANTCFFDFPIRVGSPRYLVCRSTACTPRILLSSSLFIASILAGIVISIFCRLICYPYTLSYRLIILLIAYASCTFSLVKRIVSSAKKQVRY